MNKGMQNMLFKTLVATATVLIPRAIEETYEYFFGESKKEETSEKTTSDRSTLKQSQKDYVIRQYAYWKKHGKTSTGIKCKTQKELISHFNERFGTNKSRSSFARIWNK